MSIFFKKKKKTLNTVSLQEREYILSSLECYIYDQMLFQVALNGENQLPFSMYSEKHLFTEHGFSFFWYFFFSENGRFSLILKCHFVLLFFTLIDNLH